MKTKQKPISLTQRIECVKREIKMRQKVYAKKVEAGSMPQAKADEEIETMRAVLNTLLELELKTETLFAVPKSNKKGELEVYQLTINKPTKQGFPEVNLKVFYLGGLLWQIENIESLSLSATARDFRLPIPYVTGCIPDILSQNKWLQIKRIPTQPIHQRVAGFMQAYQKEFGIRYKGLIPKEGKIWKQHISVPADKEALAFYMGLKAYPFKGSKTIMEYVKRYHEIIQLVEIKKRGEKLPDAPDPQYNKLSNTNPALYSQYRKHWISLGWRQVTTGGGRSKWVKQQ